MRNLETLKTIYFMPKIRKFTVPNYTSQRAPCPKKTQGRSFLRPCAARPDCAPSMNAAPLATAESGQISLHIVIIRRGRAAHGGGVGREENIIQRGGLGLHFLPGNEN